MRKLKKIQKDDKAITIIALIITIIVLIILASISITAIVKNNGTISKGIEAKESAEINEEKKAFKASILQVVERKKNITLERTKEDQKRIADKLSDYTGLSADAVDLGAKELSIHDKKLVETSTEQEYLYTGTSKIAVVPTNDSKYIFVAQFVDSKRNYYADEDGNVVYEGDLNEGYVIKHYLQNINDSNYTIAKEDSYELFNNTTVNINKLVTSFLNANAGAKYERAEHGTTEIDMNATVTVTEENNVISLYYKRNSYTLTLVKGNNIASVTGGGSNIKWGQSVNISAILNSGALFSVWESNNKELLQNQKSQNATIIMPAGNVKLTAQATSSKSTLTINPNGGTIETISKTGTKGERVSIGTPTPPNGYTVTFDANISGLSNPSSITSKKIFSYWSKVTGDGTIEGTDFIFGESNSTVKANYSDESITLPTLTKTGYTFNGWYDAASNGKKIENAGGSYTPTKDIKLYAQWKPLVYKIALDNQSATSGGSTAVYEKYGSGIYKENECTTQITTNANAITNPTRNYTVEFNYNGNGTSNTQKTSTYTFGGYYTAISGKGSQMINASGYITSVFTNSYYTANNTLYAKWSGGGVGLPELDSYRNGSTIYTFTGWYDAQTNGNLIGTGGEYYYPTENKMLYAHWSTSTASAPTININRSYTTSANGKIGKDYLEFQSTVSDSYGLKSITWTLKTTTGTTVSTYTDTSINSSTNSTVTHKFENLEPGTGYKITAIATSITALTATDNYDGMVITTKSYTVADMQVGDYIGYSVNTSNSATLDSSFTGVSENQNVTATSLGSTEWRVLYNDSTGVQILSSNSIGTLKLQGKTGYNGIELALNKMSSIALNSSYASKTRAFGTAKENWYNSNGTVNLETLLAAEKNVVDGTDSENTSLSYDNYSTGDRGQILNYSSDGKNINEMLKTPEIIWIPSRYSENKTLETIEQETTTEGKYKDWWAENYTITEGLSANLADWQNLTVDEMKAKYGEPPDDYNNAYADWHNYYTEYSQIPENGWDDWRYWLAAQFGEVKKAGKEFGIREEAWLKYYVAKIHWYGWDHYFSSTGTIVTTVTKTEQLTLYSARTLENSSTEDVQVFPLMSVNSSNTTTEFDGSAGARAVVLLNNSTVIQKDGTVTDSSGQTWTKWKIGNS